MFSWLRIENGLARNDCIECILEIHDKSFYELCCQTSHNYSTSLELSNDSFDLLNLKVLEMYPRIGAQGEKACKT